MIILTRSMIYINVVLIADRIEKKKNMDSYDLEKISDEYFKQIEILTEILDNNHIQGSAKYFSSIRSRDDFIENIKNNISKINLDELKKIQNYWKIKNEVID